MVKTDFSWQGFLSFFIVLILMPLGHVLMIVVEELLMGYKFYGAGAIGFLGFFVLVYGVLKSNNLIISSLFGLLAGVLVWTGWVEFSFVWIAEKYNVSPLIENNEITTKPEYLVMMSSVGLLSTVLIYFLFNNTKCVFFSWIQRNLGLTKYIKTGVNKPLAIVTFFETITILWSFYLVLLFVYDKDFAGEQHFLTYLVAFGSLFWSIYLFFNLLKIKKMDYAIRYAIPTVIIFWNFIEIMGRWNLFKEIWLHPFDHWIENSLFLVGLIFSIYTVFMKTKKISHK